MKTITCQNCGHHCKDKYCESCGQKTSTRRLSLAYIFTHDFLHILFHIDKGILYTLKELFIRPGHSIRKYIQGKRVKHFNYLSLLIILIGVGQILYENPILHMQDPAVSAEMNGFISWVDKIVTGYARIFKLAQIPLFAFITMLMFKKAGLNFAEHLVLNAYIMAFMIFAGLLCDSIIAITGDVKLIDPIHTFNTWLWVIYSAFFYFQFFSAYKYRKFWLFLRSVASPPLAMILTTILLMGVYAVIIHASLSQVKSMLFE